jgi:trans-aconitate 2-methyltransferase
MWSPEQYGRYADERSVPFFDLLAKVTLEAPRAVADLGCGPGTLTATLTRRWPEARVFGVDSSREMIAAAASLTMPDRLTFELGDLGTWRPPGPLDLVVANASLQWLGDHGALLGKLAGDLAPGGVVAIQMPYNFAAPSHTLLREVTGSPRWAARLAAHQPRGAPVEEPVFYLERFMALGLAPTIWETTYYHVLAGDDPVFEWTLGTALRPLWAELDEGERAAFRADYGARLREAYPARSFGTLFPFRRLFLVAAKAA